MRRFERVVIQTEFLHRPRTEILHHNVTLLDKLHEYLAPTLRLEVERDALLPAVHTHEIEAEPVFKRTEVPRFVPCAGLFDFNHLRPQVAEKHRRIRAGEDTGEVEHLDSV